MRKLVLLILLALAFLRLNAQNDRQLSFFYLKNIKEVNFSGIEQRLSYQFKTSYDANNVNIYFWKRNARMQHRLRPKGQLYGQWIEKDGDKVTFVHLKEGQYYFDFKEFGSPYYETFLIDIEKPWWRAWWFWVICFLTFFGLFYGRERFLKINADEEERQHRKIVELELKTLQLQMNPHFIFNALNSIQSYVVSNEVIKANDYLSKFANLIRSFLDSSRSKYISVSEEIKLLSLYAEMEKLRFDNKFDFQINVDPNINQLIEIPTMILQPFVENAINHGLRYKKSKGYLHIDFNQTEHELICTIKDNGIGRQKASEIKAKSKKGYQSQGMEITRERLETYNKLNNSRVKFLIQDLFAAEEEEVGTLIVVKFPKNL